MQKKKLEIKIKEVKSEIQSDSFIGVGPCTDWSNYWTISPNGFDGALKDDKTLKDLINSISEHPGNATILAATLGGAAVGASISAGNPMITAASGLLPGSATCIPCHY